MKKRYYELLPWGMILRKQAMAIQPNNVNQLYHQAKGSEKRNVLPDPNSLSTSI
jgi:hypothetical protein